MKYHYIAQSARSFVAFLLVVIAVMALFSSFGTSSIARAQESDSETIQLSCNDIRGKEGLSVRVPEQADVVTAPGSVFTVPVTVGNSYDYELRDLSVGAVVLFNGNPVPYDWFTVASGLDVAAQSDKVVDLTWTVPHNAPKGSYELAVYVDQGGSEHLLTNALGRNALKDSLQFKVTGDTDAGALFDMSSIKVNGKAMTAGAINTFAADAENLQFSIDMVNDLKDNPQIGPVTFTVYESFYPHSLSELESETFEARLLSQSREVYNLDFGANFDQYIVTAQFKAEDGSQSSFLILLQREGVTDTLTQPLPTVRFIGVAAEGDSSKVIACIENHESALLADDELAPTYGVSYRMSVHPIDAAGEPVRSDLITNAAGEAQLGGGLFDFGFSQTFARTEQFMVRVEVLKAEEVIDVREVRYQCDPNFGCAMSPEYLNGHGHRTIFGIGISAIILGMQLVTLALLITVISIFFCNIYPLVMRVYKRRQDGDSTKQ